MQFPIAIHREDGSVYGVTVPDIPGCHSWGETLDDVVRNARDAITGHVETLVALGEELNISCSTMEALATSDDYAGAIWALAEVDLTKLDAKPGRINVSCPRFVLENATFDRNRDNPPAGICI